LPFLRTPKPFHLAKTLNLISLDLDFNPYILNPTLKTNIENKTKSVLENRPTK
jgi:hypothetical protein